jgi:hypothetical protein
MQPTPRQTRSFPVKYAGGRTVEFCDRSQILQDVIFDSYREVISQLWLGDLEVQRILLHNGIRTIGDARTTSDIEYLNMHGIGGRRLSAIRRALADHQADIARRLGASPGMIDTPPDAERAEVMPVPRRFNVLARLEALLRRWELRA